MGSRILAGRVSRRLSWTANLLPRHGAVRASLETTLFQFQKIKPTELIVGEWDLLSRKNFNYFNEGRVLLCHFILSHGWQ
mmetsp:Transcript_23227/g.32435  ORF Transcript_23227/g.32435 Transcript_23227/m.32435 type:complete len:80 (+) Transcript_23227:1647-1886(+)